MKEAEKIHAPRSLIDPRARKFWRQLKPICLEKGSLNPASALVLARICEELANFEEGERDYHKRFGLGRIKDLRQLAQPLGIIL